ncbi:MAG TPA: hypothetical protein VMT15_01285 [Bryobacteraceae bacterium]|nr:hypothetical protein [Bryobacteraceae bacterium]
MRRLMAAFVLLTFVAFGSTGCRRKKKIKAREDGLASVVNVADPADSAQLVRGFSNVEADAWRWSTSKFSVVLRPPAGAAQNGAKLQMVFTLHEAVVKPLGPITVNATVNGTAVAPETYSAAGDYTYTKDVPASALGSDVVTVEFTTDKALAPTDKDKRELALIVKSIGLVP